MRCTYIYIFIYIYIYMGQARECPRSKPGGAKRATSVNSAASAPAELGGESPVSLEIEPVRRSFCRHGSCTFTEVARLVPYGQRGSSW